MNYTHDDLIDAWNVWRNTFLNEYHTRMERWHIYCSIRDDKPLDYYQQTHDSKFTFQKLVQNKLDQKAWN